MLTTLELTLRRLPDGSRLADAVLTSDASVSASRLAANVPVALDQVALLALLSDPAAYGRELGAQFFADARLREAWLRARAHAVAGVLQLRLNLDAGDAALHVLRWEALRDPETDEPYALHERVRLVRTLESADLTPVVIPPRPELRALVVVSNPSNLADFGFAEVDVEGELARARTALGDIPTTVLGDNGDAVGRATLANMMAALHDGPQIVILVAHGAISEDGPAIWLEQDDGVADIVGANAVAQTVERLMVRPLLVALLSCQSAGRGYGDTLSALGPQLALLGVPAVLAFQGNVLMSTVKTLLPPLIMELRRDGQIDRAMAAARAALGERRDWWQAVLWLRTDGQLWDERREQPTGRQERLRALLHDHSGFIESRLEAFVGREAELEEIRRQIAAKLPTGGYVTVTGQAGQGKSSVIAKLVADALGAQANLHERLRQPGEGVPICHFIPFSPGPDHQVGLLRNLLARLCLTYDLPDLYVAADSRAALRDYFAAALRDAAQRGGQVVIYLDGLDQIEEDLSGVRDLSFLPEEPPAGVVFVLGTRPNDTLKPLQLRKPQHEYWLPNLARADFAAILRHRGVTLDVALADRFYAAMQENALYLDLVARELAQADAISPEQIIARVADDPASLFSLSLERLQRNERLWEAVLYPILGLLLAARAPLSKHALRALIGADTPRTSRGLERLGGLIQRDGEGRYGLFHLKLGDHLRQTMVAADEEVGCHRRLAAWCAADLGVIWQEAAGDALEQERRAYARQHYVAHLASGRSDGQLWALIDAGDYSRGKLGWDPSTRGLALDLDIARQSLVRLFEGDAAAQLRLLPRLWRYSMLRCALSSRVDQYPEDLFLVLVELGRGAEALNLAELISDSRIHARTIRAIAHALATLRDPNALAALVRARELSGAPAEAAKIARSLAALGMREEALHTLVRVPPSQSYKEADAYDSVVSARFEILADAGRLDEAQAVIAGMPAGYRRNSAVLRFAEAMCAAGQPDAAYDLLQELYAGLRLPEEIADLFVRIGPADQASALVAGTSPPAKQERLLRRAIAARRDTVDQQGLRELITVLANAEGVALSALMGALRELATRPEEARPLLDAIRRRLADPALSAAERSLMVRGLAEAAGQNGWAELAGKSFEQAAAIAVDMLSADPEDPEARDVLRRLTRSLGQAGRLDLAVAIADGLPKHIPYGRDRALGEMTQALLQEHKWAGATMARMKERSLAGAADLARLIDPGLAEYAAISEALATAQAAARLRVEQPGADPPTRPADWEQALADAGADAAAIRRLVAAAAQAGNWTLARRAAERIKVQEHEGHYTQALIAIITAAARAGRDDIVVATLDEALATVELILIADKHGFYGDITGRIWIATALIDLGLLDHARRCLAGLRTEYTYGPTSTQLGLAEAYIKHGRLQAARAIMPDIPTLHDRAAFALGLVRLLMRFGHLEEAELTLRVLRQELHAASIQLSDVLAIFRQIIKALARLPATVDISRALVDLIRTMGVGAAGAKLGNLLSGAAAELAEAGLHPAALELAVTIDEPNWRAEAVKKIVTNLSRSGGRAAIDAAVAAIADPGRRAAARQVFDATPVNVQAVAHSRPAPPAPATTRDADNVAALADLAERDWRAARASAAQIEDPAVRHAALLAIVRRLSASASWDSAEAVLGDLRAAKAQVVARCTLAAALSRAGHDERADQLLAEAERIVAALADPTDRELALQELAVTQIRRGRWDAAQATLQRASINPRAAGPMLQRALIEALCQVGETDAAQEIAVKLPISGERSAAYRQIAGALIRAGRWEDAERLVGNVGLSAGTLEILNALGPALVRAGRWEEAERLVGRITDDRDRDKLLYTLATGLTDDGEWALARRVIAAMSVLKEEALVALAKAQAAAGLWEEAVAVTTELPTSRSAASAGNQLRTALAEALALERRWDEATALIEEIKDPKLRLSSEQALTIAMARAGALQPALRRLSEEWLRARRLDELFPTFAIDPALLAPAPEVGQELLDGLAWVNAQLAAV